MTRSFTSVVLTANDLCDGDAVWWTGAGWSRDIALARVLDAEADAAEAEAELAGRGDLIGLTRVEVAAARGAPWPILRREQIRADRRPTFAYAPADALARAA